MRVLYIIRYKGCVLKKLRNKEHSKENIFNQIF